MEIRLIKKGSTEEITYNGLDLLEKLATEITDKNKRGVPLRTENQDDVDILAFIELFKTILPTLKNMVSEYQKIKDSETFRNKIIDREAKNLTRYIEMLDVGKITEKPTDLQILKMQIKSTLEITVKVLEKLKDTYSKNENTLRIEM